MLPAPLAPAAAALPPLIWPERETSAAALAAERAELIVQRDAAPRRSSRRALIEERLRLITLRLLQADVAARDAAAAAADERRYQRQPWDRP